MPVCQNYFSWWFFSQQRWLKIPEQQEQGSLHATHVASATHGSGACSPIASHQPSRSSSYHSIMSPNFLFIAGSLEIRDWHFLWRRHIILASWRQEHSHGVYCVPWNGSSTQGTNLVGLLIWCRSQHLHAAFSLSFFSTSLSNSGVIVHNQSPFRFLEKKKSSIFNNLNKCNYYSRVIDICDGAKEETFLVTTISPLTPLHIVAEQHRMILIITPEQHPLLARFSLPISRFVTDFWVSPPPIHHRFHTT